MSRYSYITRFSRVILILLVLVLLSGLFLSANVECSANIKVTINGQAISMDVPPLIKDGRTMVPLRAIFEALGASVHWDPLTEKIIGSKANTNIILYIGNKSATVNGNPITLDVAAQIINGRTMVPIRFIAESLGAKVDWNATTNIVSIFSDIRRETRISSNLDKIPLSVKEIVALVQPAAVLIQTHRSSGSGVVVSTDGEVLTNAHVVRGSQWINVKTSNGQTYSAKIIKINNSDDLALVKISANQTFPIIEYILNSREIIPR